MRGFMAAALAGAAALWPDRLPAAGAPSAPQVQLPAVGLRAAQLAVVFNETDPASVELARHYAGRRGIPPSNLIGVRFPVGQASIDAPAFVRARSELLTRLPAGVQALALAWTLPYRVECMSITSAFAFGFDRDYCAHGCRPTRPSPYFDSPADAPFSAHGILPSMLLAGRDTAAVQALIERGVRADERWPVGTAYLMNTSDAKRNVRAAGYEVVRQRLGRRHTVRIVQGDQLRGAQDVMFLFSGLARVPAMDQNHYLDGAIADHLTSLGGLLDGSPQSTAVDWLSAGATGSYGTVQEPCSFPDKFPVVSVVMRHYLRGESLIEAYWKSVRMPGQGVFVGEPLARPFGGVRVERMGTRWVLRTHQLAQGRYVLEGAIGSAGPYRPIGEWLVPASGGQPLPLPEGVHRAFRLLALPPRAP